MLKKNGFQENVSYDPTNEINYVQYYLILMIKGKYSH